MSLVKMAVSMRIELIQPFHRLYALAVRCITSLPTHPNKAFLTEKQPAITSNINIANIGHTGGSQLRGKFIVIRLLS